MYYLAILLFVPVLMGTVYTYIEAGLLKVEHVKFTNADKCLKVVHLSDIHMQWLRVPAKKIKKVIMDENPDYILMSGDYIEKAKDIPKFLSFLNEIKGHHQVYMTFGNHDYKTFKNDLGKIKAYKMEIEKTGTTVLDNTSVTIEKNSKKYNIIGIQDIRYQHDDIPKALSQCHKDTVSNIAISHNPDVVLKIPPKSVDYLFCGHFHGRQIWAPFQFEYRFLRHDVLGRKGIIRGLHLYKGIQLYINRGLGNVCFPFRLFSRPEITICHIP